MITHPLEMLRIHALRARAGRDSFLCEVSIVELDERIPAGEWGIDTRVQKDADPSYSLKLLAGDEATAEQVRALVDIKGNLERFAREAAELRASFDKWVLR